MTVFLENSGGANGLFFDEKGNLIACEGANGRVVSIDSTGKITVLADKYDNKSFNEPNDLWIDAKGGVYFSDPLYIKTSLVQDGEHVYYITPKRDNIVRVISDMVRPNGIIGSADGKTLYVADHGAGKTYKYTINDNGSLSDKTLFASSGSDGMTIDSEGNIYLTTTNGVRVYSSSGSLIETIALPTAGGVSEEPTNVCFGGVDSKTLYITARTSVYSLKMRVKGVSSSATTPGDNDTPPSDTGSLDKKMVVIDSPSAKPSNSQYFAAGSMATGGNSIQLEATFPDFKEKVNIYLAVNIPTAGFFFIDEKNSLTQKTVPWKEQVSGIQSEIILPAISIYDESGRLTIPSGKYTFYSVVLPSTDYIETIDWNNGRYDLRYFNVNVVKSGGSSSFSLTSDVGVEGGTIPIEYSCDGEGNSPALSWSNAPSGTKEFALMMTTLPGDGTTKWNWVLYSIPVSTTGLSKNGSGIGTLGASSHGGDTLTYAPPCSEGPGAKLYTFTLYALSESPELPDVAEQVTGEVLTKAISSITIDSTSLNLNYTRQ